MEAYANIQRTGLSSDVEFAAKADAKFLVFQVEQEGGLESGFKPKRCTGKTEVEA